MKTMTLTPKKSMILKKKSKIEFQKDALKKEKDYPNVNRRKTA